MRRLLTQLDSIMWELLSNTVSSYTISYQNINNTECFMDYSTISNITAMNYTLRNLQEATEYSITVSGILSDGKTKVPLRATTLAAGQHWESYYLYIMESIITVRSIISFSSICSPHLRESI